MSIVSALSVLGRSEERGPSELADTLMTEVESGHPLSRAFSRWPEHFGLMFVGTIRMAENTGTMVTAFRALAAELERRERARQALLAALTYPLALLVTTLGMLAFLIYYMLPRFLPFLVSAKVETPALTRAVMWLGESPLLKPLPLLFVLVAFGIWENKRSRALLGQFSHYAIRLPLVGTMIKLKAYSDACLQLSLQLRCGILLTEAVSAVASSTPSPFLRASFQGIHAALKAGESLSEALREDKLAPPFLVQMVSTGEEVGKLEYFFERVGRILEEEYNRRSEAFFQLLEPMLMMIMGLAVGLVVLACFLPIYKLSSGVL